MTNLKEYLKKTRESIVAIGFNPKPDQITILGTGFISNGKIITCAHLLNRLSEEQVKGLKANVMIEKDGKEIGRNVVIIPEVNSAESNGNIVLFVLSKFTSAEIEVLG